MRRASSACGRAGALGIAVLLFWGAACDAPGAKGSATHAPARPSGTDAAPVECEPLVGEPLAVIDGGACPLVLTIDGSPGEVLLEHTTKPKSVVARGELPGACRGGQACEIEGTTTDRGAVLSVVLKGHASEMPEGSWLGLAHEQTLGFVELWGADPSDLDGTREGPTYALVPHVCKEGVVLAVERRLASVSGEQAPESLVARAGALVWSAKGEWTTEPTAKLDDSCVVVDLVWP